MSRDPSATPEPGSATRVAPTIARARDAAGSGVVAALVVGLALRLWLALSTPGPFVHADEAGYFALARHLAGAGPDPQLYFYPGYAFALTPSFVVTDDPALAYRLALLTNCALGALAIVLAARVGRVLSRHPLAPGAAAMVVALYPALVLNTALTWSENLLPTLVLALALSIASAARAPAAAARWIAPGAIAGALHLTHPRMLPVALAVALVALVVTRPSRGRLLPLAVALGSAGLAVALAQVVARAVSSPNAAYSDEAVPLTRAFEQPGPTIAALAGVAIYALAATFGVAGLGAAHAIRRLPDLLRRSGRPVEEGDAVALALLLVAAALVAVSVLAMAVPEPTRGDYLVYGRYAEPGIVGLLVIGAVALVDPARRRGRLLVGSALLTVPCAAALLLLRSEAVRALPANQANIWGITPATVSWESVVPLGLTGGGVRPFAIAALGLAGAAILVVAARVAPGRGTVVVGALGALFLAGMVTTYDRIVEPTAAMRERERVVPGVLRQVAAVAPDVTCVALDRKELSPWHRWDVVFETRLAVELSDGSPAARAACGGLLLTAARDIEARYPGALALVGEVGAPQTLWVLPGGLAERLRRVPGLVATGQRPLPDVARSARVALAAGPATLAPGATGRFEVAIENTGGGPPWSAAALHPVELVALWVPRGRFGPVFATVREPLGSDLAAGASTVVALDVPAEDREGGGLPPGAYDLLVRVEEAGLGPFPSARAKPLRLALEVAASG